MTRRRPRRRKQRDQEKMALSVVFSKGIEPETESQGSESKLTYYCCRKPGLFGRDWWKPWWTRGLNHALIARWSTGSWTACWNGGLRAQTHLTSWSIGEEPWGNFLPSPSGWTVIPTEEPWIFTTIERKETTLLLDSCVCLSVLLFNPGLLSSHHNLSERSHQRGGNSLFLLGYNWGGFLFSHCFWIICENLVFLGKDILSCLNTVIYMHQGQVCCLPLVETEINPELYGQLNIKQEEK